MVEERLSKLPALSESLNVDKCSYGFFLRNKSWCMVAFKCLIICLRLDQWSWLGKCMNWDSLLMEWAIFGLVIDKYGRDLVNFQYTVASTWWAPSLSCNLTLITIEVWTFLAIDTSNLSKTSRMHLCWDKNIPREVRITSTLNEKIQVTKILQGELLS